MMPHIPTCQAPTSLWLFLQGLVVNASKNLRNFFQTLAFPHEQFLQSFVSAYFEGISSITSNSNMCNFSKHVEPPIPLAGSSKILHPQLINSSTTLFLNTLEEPPPIPHILQMSKYVKIKSL